MNAEPERRQTPRVHPSAMGLEVDGVLRPGVAVCLLNVSAGGALVDASAAVRPGAVTELQVSRAGRRQRVEARVMRCWVASLRPLRYRARLMFRAQWEGAEVSDARDVRRAG